MGVAQMEQLPGFVQRKKEVDALDRIELQGVGDISFQEVKSEVYPNCWLFTAGCLHSKQKSNAMY